MKKHLVTLALVASASFSLPALAGSTVSLVEAAPEDVSGCRHLGGVGGLFTWRGSPDVPSEAKAREAARQDAEKIGATHLVWTGGTSSYGSHGEGETFVEADAFACTARA